MKRNLKISLLGVVFGVVFGGAKAIYAQTEDLKTPIVGGYLTAETTDAQVVSSAKFAVKAQAKKQKAKIKLVSVSKAEKQIVAGTNYQMCLQVEVLEKGKPTAVPQTVQTIVYLNTKQKAKLTSWAIAACTDEMPTQIPNK